MPRTKRIERPARPLDEAAQHGLQAFRPQHELLRGKLAVGRRRQRSDNVEVSRHVTVSAEDDATGLRAGSQRDLFADDAIVVGEGGAFLSDGRGLAIATRSCLLARNPHLTADDIRAAFGSIGMRTTIWLDGDRDEPITSGHPDGCLAFAPDGTLLVEPIARGRGRRRRERDIAVLQRLVADGSISALRRFAPPEPDTFAGEPDGFAATYLNFFVTRRSLITASFGAADDAACRDLAALFPNREIRTLCINAILCGGGIRCLIQPVPSSARIGSENRSGPQNTFSSDLTDFDATAVEPQPLISLELAD